jgi:hypothetical protein
VKLSREFLRQVLQGSIPDVHLKSEIGLNQAKRVLRFPEAMLRCYL